MKVSQLSGSLRANVGKKDAKALRAIGQVPCVLYGLGTQTHFSVKDISIEKLIYNPDVFNKTRSLTRSSTLTSCNWMLRSRLRLVCRFVSQVHLVV
jgi:ribosomal protein L25 (general stress protein Ctc)